jgi:tetratricopeptide (TPR) repeat protein
LKDYPKAIQHFQRALQINPRHAVAWSNLGRVLLMANKPAEAAECFRRSLTINGANVAAHLSLANILIQANKLDDAEKHAQAVLKLIPGQPDALALLQRIRKLRTGAPIQPPTSGPPPGKAGP